MPRPWTHKERVLLSKWYYIVPWDMLEEIIPNRSYNACVKQAKYLQDRGWAFDRPKPEEYND